jgi:hypothetical protein
MDGMQVTEVPFKAGMTIWDAFNDASVPKDMPVLCVIGEEPVMRMDWVQAIDPTRPPVFITLPQGGQGGFKNIIRVVALLAVAIAAPYLAPIIAGAGAAAGTLAAISAGITLIGGLIINMILPPQVPKQNQQSIDNSPSYFTSAQGTRARPMQPVPCQYGMFKMTPDWVSDPFSDYNNNQQRIYQNLSLGVGTHQRHKVLVGDTEVWNEDVGYTGNLSSVLINFVEPGQPGSLFPGIVSTSTEVGGQTLRRVHIVDVDVTFSGTRVTARSGGTFDGDTSRTFNDFLVGDTVIFTNAGANNGSHVVTAIDPGNTKGWAEFNLTWPTQGDVDEITMDVDVSIGPYAASEPGQQIYKIAFDIAAPSGLGEANDDGGLDDNEVTFTIRYQQINDANVPIGAWIEHTDISVSAATPQPQRWTFEYDVPAGRYWGEVIRTSANHTDTKTLDDLQWLSLRGFIPDDNIYAHISRLEIIFNVGEQVTSATSRQIYVVQTRKLPWLSGGVWQPPATTRSIAWAAADMLRNTLYGAAQPDSFIDLAGLETLEGKFLAAGDTFDGIFDSPQTFWEALSAVLKVGRAFPLLFGSKVSFDRDEPKTLISGVITPRTMLVNSFNMEHILWDEDSPDDVIIEFFNKDTWQNDEIQCTLPGSTSVKPARYQMFGIIDRNQAWRYGMYQAASNFYRRVLAGCDTEMVGRLYLRGTLVLFAHDVPKWGFTGDIMFNTGVRELELSDPVDWSSPDTYYMALRTPQGRGWGPVMVTRGADDGTVIIDAADLATVEAALGPIADVLIYADDDDGREPTKYTIGAGLEKYAKKFLVSATQPDGIDSVSVLLQKYDERVYQDFGPPPPPPTQSGPGVIPSKPVVSGFFLSQNPNSVGDVVTIFGSWQPAPGANSYIVEISYDNVNWSGVYNGAANSCQFQANAGFVFARVAPIGRIRGDYLVRSGTFGQPKSVPGSITGFDSAVDNDGTITLTWNVSARATSYITEIWTESSSGSGVYNVLKLSKIVAASPAAYGSSEVGGAGGPWPRYQARVRGVNTVGTGPTATVTKAASTTPIPSITTASPLYTNDHTPFIQGTSIPFATIRVLVNGVIKAQTTASMLGAWAATLPTIAAGIWSITAVAITSQGGQSLPSTPLAATIYDDTAYIAAYTAAMTVQPSGKRRYELNKLISDLSTIWSKLDYFVVHAAHDAQAGRINAKNPAQVLTANGAPFFTIDRGYKGTAIGAGPGGYLASTFTPSTAGGQWTLNSAHLSVYIRTPSSSVTTIQAGDIGCLGAFLFSKHNTSGNITTRLNDATSNSAGAGSPVGQGHIALSRTVSTGYDRYHDGTAQSAVVVASTALPTAPSEVLRVSGSYSDAEALASSWGAGLTAAEVTILRNAIEAYKVAVGA